MTDSQTAADPRICHICKLPINGPGMDHCSYPHPHQTNADYHWCNGTKVYHSWEAYYDI